MTTRLEITSRQNERVKEAAKLREARQRTRQNRFLIHGIREIGRALDAAIDVTEAFICPTFCGFPEANKLAARLDQVVPTVAEVTVEVFDKLVFGQRTDGVVVVARTPERKIGGLTLPQNPLVAVLEGVEKPGNVGAIVRSADGAGVDAVIVVDPQTDIFNPNTIRASLGTVFSMRVCAASTAEAVTQLRAWQASLIATRPAAEKLYTEIDFRSGTAILLGSEAAGLTDVWNGADVIGVRLPMLGVADSLNVSTAAAVMFYEARRQRG